MPKRIENEPQVRVGNCCGCGACPVTLFKIVGIYRYRCDACYKKETGLRHWLASPVSLDDDQPNSGMDIEQYDREIQKLSGAGRQR